MNGCYLTKLTFDTAASGGGERKRESETERESNAEKAHCKKSAHDTALHQVLYVVAGILA